MTSGDSPGRPSSSSAGARASVWKPRAAPAEGAEVILTGRNPERLDRAARELGAQNTAAFDASDPAALTGFCGDGGKPPRLVPDWALAPGLRQAWVAGDRSRFHGWDGLSPFIAVDDTPA